MGRFKVTYPRQRDPASEARNQAVSQATIQRQQQASAYAAARFNEWAANAQQREQILNARVQQANSQAELAGAQFRYNYWKDQELRNQTTHYYNAMPVLREQLKQAGITPDTPRYAAEMAAFASTIPDALTHNEAIRKELHDFSKVAATSEQITENMKTFIKGYKDATGQAPTKVHVGANNEVTGEAPIGIPEKIADRYSRLQGAIELHKDLAARQLKDDMAHNRENMPYSDQPKLAAAMKDSSILEKAYPSLASLGSGNQATIQPTNTATAAPSPAAVVSAPTPQATPVQTPGVPQVGENRGGFIFKGGNPADQNSWEQSQ